MTDKDDSVDKYDSCSFEVFATNGFDDGRYFLRSVHVSITIYDPLHSLYSHADIYITASNDASNSGVYNVNIAQWRRRPVVVVVVVVVVAVVVTG